MVFFITVELEKENSYYSHFYAPMQIYCGTIIKKKPNQHNKKTNPALKLVAKK